MRLYKLTDQNMQTYNGFQWVLGETRKTNGEGSLCGPGWLHAYESPLLAILHNPIHANIKNPRLFIARGSGKVLKDHQLKLGVTQLTLIREIIIPKISETQKIAYSILCAKKVCRELKWCEWADNWLRGKDRSASAAYVVYAAYTSASAAAAADAAYAAYAAVDAASAYAAYAAYAAVDAASAYAAYAADASTIDFKYLAKEAMKYR